MVPTIFLHIYKFFCSDSKLHYIVRAEYHNENVFAVKFYCKKDKRSDFKYNKIINKHPYKSVIGIFNTCLLLIPELLAMHPGCSFAILSSRTIDFTNTNKLTESISRNQRFRVYSRFLQDRIGNKTFTHFQYEDLSSYLLINNDVMNIDVKEASIKIMFERTYRFIPDIN